MLLAGLQLDFCQSKMLQIHIKSHCLSDTIIPPSKMLESGVWQIVENFKRSQKLKYKWYGSNNS